MLKLKLYFLYLENMSVPLLTGVCVEFNVFGIKKEKDYTYDALWW